MHHHLYFNQDCPICHRGMRVPIEWFGTEIRCARCSSPGIRHRSLESHASASHALMESSRRTGTGDSDSNL